MLPDLRRPGPIRFPPTHVSAVLGASSDDASVRRRSLETISSVYWLPVYAHARIRWRRGPEDARDLTQEFFASVLERDVLAGFDPSRARFRTFLRLCLDRFLSNQSTAAARWKRGGHAEIVSLHAGAPEHDVAVSDPGEDLDRRFDEAWVRSVVGLAVRDLREALVARGRGIVVAVFEAYDLADEDARPTYGSIAQRLGIKVTDVTNHLAAARRELRAAVLRRLRELTASDEEFRCEARVVLGFDPP